MTTADDTQQPARRPGRPRQHGSDQARYAAANKRRAQERALVGELAHAVLSLLSVAPAATREAAEGCYPEALEYARSRADGLPPEIREMLDHDWQGWQRTAAKRRSRP